MRPAHVIGFPAVVLASIGPFLAAAAPGCGASVDDYCARVCDCIGCEEDDRALCVDSIESARKKADAKGCGGEFSDHFSCVSKESLCLDGWVDTDGCEEQAANLAACTGDQIGFDPTSCTTVCQRVAVCDKPSAPKCFAALTGCPAVQQRARTTGCGPEYFLWGLCHETAKDPCSIAECVDYVAAFSVCVATYCNQHPTEPECGDFVPGNVDGGAGGGG